jgi:hypothetical protein
MFGSKKLVKIAGKRYQYLRWNVLEHLLKGVKGMLESRYAGIIVPSICQVCSYLCDHAHLNIFQNIHSWQIMEKWNYN